jgi:hypothetical protein
LLLVAQHLSKKADKEFVALIKNISNARNIGKL